MSLVTSTAFQFNPAIQPRAFVVLGCLACDEVDDDLLYQILVALKGALSLFDDNDTNLIISIVMCLTNISANLAANCKYLQQLFWLAVSLLQIGHVPLFPPALNLMQVVLRNLEENRFFMNESPSAYLMRARESLKEFQGDLATAFEINFPFALSSIILKGMKHPLTVSQTKATLSTLLDISCKHRDRDGLADPTILGYLAPLLPQAAKNSELIDLLKDVGVTVVNDETTVPQQSYIRIYEKLIIPDETTAILLLSTMVTLLNNAEFEAEQLFIYRLMADVAKAFPEVFVTL